MKRTIRTACLTLAAAGAVTAHGAAAGADLTIHVANVRNANGDIRVALYDGAGDFLKRPVRVASAPASTAGATLVIKDLAPGDYGISAYHDANANGKMDTNLIGMPVEPHAFSRDARGRMGPPSFDAARLAVPAAGLDTTVTLR